MRHLGIIHDKVLAYLPEEMKEEMMRNPTNSMNMKAVEKKENKTKSAAISTKRKAENGEGQRSVKPKIWNKHWEFLNRYCYMLVLFTQAPSLYYLVRGVNILVNLCLNLLND